MALTDQQKASVVYHLGYADTNTHTSAFGGNFASWTFTSLVRTACDNINSTAEARVIEILTQMDSINTQLASAPSRLRVEKLGDISLNESEQDDIYGVYRKLGYQLADLIGVQPNLDSDRYSNKANFNISL